MKGNNPSVSLFAVLSKPVAIYLIDNELIGFEKYPDSEFHGFDMLSGYVDPHSTYSILLYLFHFEGFKKIVPSNLHQYIKVEGNAKENSITTELLSDSSESHRLIVTIEYNDQRPKPIRLYDFYYKSIKLSHELYLTNEEAFLLFSNLLASTYVRDIMDVNKDDEEASFHKILYDKISHINDKGYAFVFLKDFSRINDENYHFEDMYYYITEYLITLRKKILNGKCDLEQLLLLSGAKILVYLAEMSQISEFIKTKLASLDSITITNNEKLIILTLIDLLRSKTAFGNFIESYKISNRESLITLREQLWKPFPGKLEDKVIGEYLPLFLQENEYTAVHVIDNNVIGYLSLWCSSDQHPIKAFLHILELYSNDVTQRAIPERFHKWLSMEKPNTEKIDPFFNFLIGNEEIRVKLDVSLKISDEPNAEVTIDNILFDEHDLDLTFKLSAKEAFYIFANIATNGTRQYHDLISKNNYQLTSLKTLEEFFTEQIELGKTYPGVDYWVVTFRPMFYFVNDYLQYILEEVKANRISLFDILKFGGVQVISCLAGYDYIQPFILNCLDKLKNYESLSRNEKIMYYTLIRAIEGPKELYETIRTFIQSNRFIINTIEDSLKVDFPYDARDIALRNFNSSIKKEEIGDDYNEIIQLSKKDFLEFLNQPLKIPFFAYLGKNSVILLNNELVGYSPVHSLTFNDFLIHNLLKKLYQSAEMRKIIPKELCDNFDFQSDYLHEERFHCLFGNNLGIEKTCFAFSLRIDEKSRDIYLNNFSYGNTPVNQEVTLSFQDAFFSFANLLINSVFDNILQLLEMHDKKISDIEYLKKQIIEDSLCFEERFKMKDPKSNAMLFSIDYLNYIRNKTEQGILSPSYILKENGLSTIMCLCNSPPFHSLILNILDKFNDIESLTFNQKLLFFTLIEDLPFNSKIRKPLKEFYIKNKQLLQKLAQTFHKEYPLPPKIKPLSNKINYNFIPAEEKISREDFWKIIAEVKRQEFKILLMKSSGLMKAQSDIHTSLSNKKLDYPTLNIIRLLYDIMKKVDIPQSSIDFDKEKIKFDNLPTKETILELIKYQYKDEQFSTDEKTGQKILFISKIAPEKKDLVYVIGLFDFNQLLNKMDESIIKLVIDALLELSKEKVLILPHPACPKEPMIEGMFNAVFDNANYDDHIYLSKDFLKKAKVITYEPI